MSASRKLQCSIQRLVNARSGPRFRARLSQTRKEPCCFQRPMMGSEQSGASASLDMENGGSFSGA